MFVTRRIVTRSLTLSYRACYTTYGCSYPFTYASFDYISFNIGLWLLSTLEISISLEALELPSISGESISQEKFSLISEED